MKLPFALYLVVHCLAEMPEGRCQEIFVQNCNFFSPEGDSYVESRIYIDSKSWTASMLEDSMVQVEVHLTAILRTWQQELVQVERVALLSPPSRKPGPFLHVFRWPVLPGNYLAEINAVDGQNPELSIGVIDSVAVRPFFGELILSDLQLMQGVRPGDSGSNPFEKNGIYGEPVPFDVVDRMQRILNVYFESHSADSIPPKAVYRFTLTRLRDGSPVELHSEWFRRRKQLSIDPFLLSHDISELTTGDYRLTVELQDERGHVVDSRQCDFRRENPFWDQIARQIEGRVAERNYFDSLPLDRVEYGIRALHPLIEGAEGSAVNLLLKRSRERDKRLFLFSYFAERYDTAVPAFEIFIRRAEYVDKTFQSGFGYGFESDRGRIYMRYGIPDEVIREEREPGAFPYEIWKYNKLTHNGQTNVRFLFYNPDLAGSDFRLLHSTAIGERQNRRWEIELYRNVPNEQKGSDFFEATEMLPGFNRRAREYFEN
ncbi:MAG: hypothetical protein JPMHGGIA_01145 [Saprospiraceae bacterium]|nr:hypothetical protein [Saprospiraceae bacterium]